MNQAVQCLRCHTQMEPGYIPDMKEGGFSQQYWHPGQPEKSFWLGLKMNRDKLVAVTTLRCPKCGYLESYAFPKGTPTQ